MSPLEESITPVSRESFKLEYRDREIYTFIESDELVEPVKRVEEISCSYRGRLDSFRGNSTIFPSNPSLSEKPLESSPPSPPNSTPTPPSPIPTSLLPLPLPLPPLAPREVVREIVVKVRDRQLPVAPFPLPSPLGSTRSRSRSRPTFSPLSMNFPFEKLSLRYSVTTSRKRTSYERPRMSSCKD